jgi:hypothetical protein
VLGLRTTALGSEPTVLVRALAGAADRVVRLRRFLKLSERLACAPSLDLDGGLRVSIGLSGRLE